MSKGIRLHPKFGLNPTMPVCFFCGRDTGEVALLGAAYRGEAPMKMVLNKRPCAACEKEWAEGIAFVEASRINGDTEPTGRVVVVKREAVARMVQQPLLDDVLRAGKALVEPEAFEQLFAGELTEAPVQ